MAEIFHIPGPGVVDYAISAASPSFAIIGRWDNDAAVEWSEEERFRDVTTNSGGETPEESINRGIVGRLSFPLTKWDDDAIIAMKKASNMSAGGVAAGYKFPVIGGIQVGTIASPGGGIFDIRIRPLISSRPQFVFKYQRLMGVDIGPQGNNPLVIGMRFMLMRPSDATDNTPYIIRSSSS